MRMVRDRILVCAPTVPEFLEAQKSYFTSKIERASPLIPLFTFKVLFPAYGFELRIRQSQKCDRLRYIRIPSGAKYPKTLQA